MRRAAVLLALVPWLAAAAPAATVPPTLIAAGDIASCRSSGDTATARVVARIPGTIAALGDTVYEHGTTSEYARCYAPTWGRFRARTRPAVGNHEYGVAGAAGFFRYFGARAPRPGYYSYDLGAWHVVVLNTNCARVGGCHAGSPQERWLRRDLAARPARCALAYGHHPRLSSGLHGPTPAIEPLWRALREHGVELYLAGHDHHYERFAPRAGLRQFVVGTGGRSLYRVSTARPGSEVRHARSYGVLALTLREDGYDWRFVAAGGSFADAGTGTCDGAAAGGV